MARELVDMLDRLACGRCLLWAKHDALVATAKAASQELDVRACSRPLGNALVLIAPLHIASTMRTVVTQCACAFGAEIRCVSVSRQLP